MDSFLDRLRWAAHGRVFNSWFKEFGWNRGDLDRVNKGGIPGPEKLMAISAVENLNLNWLLAWRGSPYQMEFAADAAEAGQLLSRLSADGGWNIEFLAGEGPSTLLLHKRALLPDGTEYCQVEMITGPFTRTATLETSLHGAQSRFLAAPLLDQIRRGLVGPYILFSLPELASKAAHSVGETPQVYQPASRATSFVQPNVLQAIARLDPEELDMVKVLLRGIEKSRKD